MIGGEDTFCRSFLEGEREDKRKKVRLPIKRHSKEKSLTITDSRNSGPEITATNIRPTESLPQRLPPSEKFQV